MGDQFDLIKVNSNVFSKNKENLLTKQSKELMAKVVKKIEENECLEIDEFVKKFKDDEKQDKTLTNQLFVVKAKQVKD